MFDKLNMQQIAFFIITTFINFKTEIMKKIFSFLFASLIFSSFAFGQTVLFEDNFDGLTAGSKFVEQANQDWWDTWSNAPGGSEDPVVSDAQSNSASNSVYLAANNDVILKLGDRASGEYEVDFYYYIETGEAAYFNTQHYEAPGSEWAFGAYFEGAGSGVVTANSVDYSFTYPENQWFLVNCNYDLDNDECTVNINGTEVGTWQFSVLENGGTGAKRLGCINFYGGSTADPYNFYLDDVSVTEVIPSTPPTTTVDATEINFTSGPETFTITNDGIENLEYMVYATYPETAVKDGAIQNATLNSSRDMAELTHISSDISYYGYLFDGTRIVREVAKMSPAKVANEGAIGMYLNSVICYVGETSYITEVAGTPVYPEFKLKVWDRGSLLTPGPGELIAEQVFTPDPYGQTIVDLDNPLYVDGRDIWFGFEYEGIGMIEGVDTLFALSRDQGPVVDNGSYITLGVGWQEEDEGNLALVGLCSGTSVNTWLSVSPASGSIQEGDNDVITVSYDATGLDVGTYSATVVVSSNDPVTPFIEIPVYLTVSAYTVTFTVDDGTDVLEGANINIDGTDLTTDASGMASIELMNGDYPYEVTMNGFDSNNGSVSIDGQNVDVNISLDQLYSVTFTVDDGTDVLEGANININGTDLTTDVNGIASIELINGDYPYVVSMTDYTDFSGNAVVADDNLDVSVSLVYDNIDGTVQATVSTFPNPATDLFKVQSDVVINSVEIISVNGQVVADVEVNSNNSNIDISNLEKGVYIVNINTVNGTSTTKLVIE